MTDREKLIARLREIASLTPPICQYDRPFELDVMDKKITVYCKPFEQFQDLLREAADALANGVVVREWISVTERLPQGADGKSLCDNVLAYLDNGEVIGQVCTGWLNGDRWYLTVGEDDHYTVWGLGAVTHWMPLPEPPKEGE